MLECQIKKSSRLDDLDDVHLFLDSFTCLGHCSQLSTLLATPHLLWQDANAGCLEVLELACFELVSLTVLECLGDKVTVQIAIIHDAEE